MPQTGNVLPSFLDDLPVAQAAARFAAEQHRGQRRSSDAAPFILHPFEVASLLRGRGFDDEVVAAGLLHDLVEDTPATLDEVCRRFGKRVGDIVAALTEDATIEDHAARKAALRRQVAGASPEALAVYAADKVAKARELRAEASHDPAGLGAESARLRLDHYRESLTLLEQAVPELPLVAQLRFEVWALEHLPPERGGET
ncbi:HD domain-containing protein [Conexibacter sp. SYSU D00693]|uniref:HD domain-containing protein n=1 Tax=Conexibacter sp. SYSU D00693 TaxID=2812560 RepID=UPI00196A7D47|nr:HD domain-containing protein [Conexibacter sp. SYSU D00693]